MENAKLNGQKTYQYVFDYFSEQILSRKLKLNDKIPTERDIAEQLGVSRNSVREVMHMLEITGLIECLQGSGNYVRCDPETYMLKSVNMIMALMEIEYQEIFDIRIGYEQMALRMAMTMAKEEEVEYLRQLLVQMDQPMSSKESARLDIEFHHKLVEASHNSLLILYYSMMDKLLNQLIENMRVKIMMNKNRAEHLRHAHWDVYNALVQKDSAAGSAALDRHFKIVADHLEKGNVFK